ncbi:MAG: MupG family TIM beta-alpha barrel fold protein [Cellulomonadaceae bacterium]|jgi:hypothetical protein|nr:MupG family TIM beta-alpha barrel fold protein [Cellulomonadaceae bacterium]
MVDSVAPKLGFSIFASDGPLDTAYINAMAAAGFTGVFTSIHIPEDNPAKYREFLRELGEATRALGLELTVDISGDALQRAGFSWADLSSLAKLGISRLRADYHISNAQIANASHTFGMCLNASTITSKDVCELRDAGADFSNLVAWHNYYPRPETGVSGKDLLAKDRFLKENGFTVVAFTPGDAKLRAPLFQGLPTLERHRHKNPLAGALDLISNGGVDEVYVGDGGLAPRSLGQFATFLKDGFISLHAKKYSSQFDYVASHQHVNREDGARDVIRSAEARFWNIPDITPLRTMRRKRGSVTIDNSKYGRYQGDIQIAKRDLPPDNRVNVVGRIIKYDRALLPHITGGVPYTISDTRTSLATDGAASGIG